MNINDKINKAIINEDLDFFENAQFTSGQKRLALEFSIRSGRFNVIQYFLEKGYTTLATKSCIKNFIVSYDRPDILQLFKQYDFDLAWGNYESLKIAAEKEQYKTVFYLNSLIEEIDHPFVILSFNYLLSKVNEQEDMDDINIIYNQCKEKISNDVFVKLIDTIPDEELRKTILFNHINNRLNYHDEESSHAKKTKI